MPVLGCIEIGYHNCRGNSLTSGSAAGAESLSIQQSGEQSSMRLEDIIYVCTRGEIIFNFSVALRTCFV